MDEYGYRAAAKTARLIERAQDGYLIIVGTAETGRLIQRRLRDAGKQKADVRVLTPDRADSLYGLRGRYGHAHFEHTWEYQCYMDALRRAGEAVEGIRWEISWGWPPSDE
jgi:hypothetical protein